MRRKHGHKLRRTVLVASHEQPQICLARQRATLEERARRQPVPRWDELHETSSLGLSREDLECLFVRGARIDAFAVPLYRVRRDEPHTDYRHDGTANSVSF